jgi:hypothetical protein
LKLKERTDEGGKDGKEGWGKKKKKRKHKESVGIFYENSLLNFVG